MPASEKVARGATTALFWSLVIGGSALADEFVQDFRHGQFEGRLLQPTRPEAVNYLHYELQGLRLKVPAAAPVAGNIGIELVTPIGGDFDVTLTIEVESLPPPDSPGLVLALIGTDGAGTSLSISRGTQAGAGQFFVVARNSGSGGAGQALTGTAPAGKDASKMRITRRGGSVKFSVADGNSLDFQQVLEVSDGGFRYSVVISVDPKECRGGIDARLNHLQVVGVPPLASYLQQPPRGLGPVTKARNPGFLWWGLGGAGGVSLAAGAVWWVKMRGGRTDEASAPKSRKVTAAPARPAAAAVESTKQADKQAEQPAAVRADAMLKELMAGVKQQTAKQSAPIRPASPVPARAISTVEPADSERGDYGAGREPPTPDTPQSAKRPTVAVTEEVSLATAPSEQAAADSNQVNWDEEALVPLEQKARDFLKVNSGAVLYGERHRFRFHFHDGKLHGAFIVWWETDVEASKAMGIKGKQIEDRLTKKFEGQYQNGERHGRFIYWSKDGRAVAVEYLGGVGGMPYALEDAGPTLDDTAADSAAVAESSAGPWDEAALLTLEQKANDFLSVNPGAVSYGERHHFRFRFQEGKLDGTFAAWWSADIEAIKAIKAMGIKGKEIEDRLPKKFEGTYAQGARHGKFTYWDKDGRCGQIEYDRGRGGPFAVAVNTSPPPAEPPPVESPPAEPPAPEGPPPPAWNETLLSELENRARDFLEDNPQVQSYVERHRFRFQVADGKLHGPFVAWRPFDSASLPALGGSKKEIEDKLPKLLEGEYRDGCRHGQFVCWDEQDRSCVMDFGEHGQAPPAEVLANSGWDEAALKALEQKADEFAEDNPGVSAYAERFQFRFGYQDGKLHGPFVAWRSVDAQTIKSLGSERKEIEDRLPKSFAGTYERGRRHGTFACWDEQGRATEVHYLRGVVRG